MPLRDLAPPRPDIHVGMVSFPDVEVEALQSGEIATGLWKLSSSRPAEEAVEHRGEHDGHDQANKEKSLPSQLLNAAWPL